MNTDKTDILYEIADAAQKLVDQIEIEQIEKFKDSIHRLKNALDKLSTQSSNVDFLCDGSCTHGHAGDP